MSENTGDSIRSKSSILIKTLYGYTDENNPFGDPNLSQTFVWDLKNKKYLSMGIDPSFLYDEKSILLKIKNCASEIEELKKLRSERESKRLTLPKIDKNLEDNKDKDKIFFINQEKLRSEIRIQLGREKPIDFLVNTLYIYEGQNKIPKNFYENIIYQKPYKIFENMSIDNLNDLYKDIIFQKSLNESNEKENEKIYWDCIFIVCESFIKKEDINLMKNEEIKSVLDNYKTKEELDNLEKEIHENLKNEYKNEEIKFWNDVLKLLSINKSRIILDNMYNEFLTKYKNNEIANNSSSINLNIFNEENTYNKKKLENKIIGKKTNNNEKDNNLINQKNKLKEIKEEEEENNKKELNSDEEVDEYLQKISGIIPQKTKEKNKETNTIKGSNLNIKESRFLIEEENFHNNLPDEKNTNIDLDEFGENENIFNETVPLNLTYDWSEKYTPIKPRYSNRVRVGYEWNKYNQVHYNIDNPPPKIIQGYKFNIFYPSLIDKTKTPTYFLERGDALGMCIIRFHAGAPYEDIAFKIVNREWDMTEKAAFKNIFDKGILKLYFKFKRYRYKR